MNRAQLRHLYKIQLPALAPFGTQPGQVLTGVLAATSAQGAKADSALQSYTETDPVASAALTTHAALTTAAHGGIATAAQGTKADSALQNAALFATAAQGAKADTALQNAGDFATASQGSKADTALQSAGAFATSSQGTKADTALQSVPAATTSVAGTMSATDKVKMDSYPAYAAKAFTNNASRTIQTVAAAANGWQLSSTRDADTRYTVSITTTATIGGAQDGYVVQEVCSTNSAVAANWQEVGRLENAQNITLAIALQSVQVIKGQICGMVQAGYYTRLRSVQASGSPAFAYVSGQEVLL